MTGEPSGIALGRAVEADGMTTRRRHGNTPRLLFELIQDYSPLLEEVDPDAWCAGTDSPWWRWTPVPVPEEDLDRWMAGGTVFYAPARQWIY